MRRRLLAMFAIAALGVSALIGAAPAVAGEPGGTAYVALGDSEAAGTGNLPYIDTTCLVSKKSYPMLLAATLGTPVVTEACTGATTGDVLAGQLGDLGPLTRLVTLTVGANDVGWLDALLACSTGGPACAMAIAHTTQALQALPAQIGQLVAVVRGAAPNARILVTGYPLLFGDVAVSCSIGALKGTPVKVTAAQTALANGLATNLNAAIAGGVNGYKALTGDPGVDYVDVAAGFDGHALCDTGRPLDQRTRVGKDERRPWPARELPRAGGIRANPRRDDPHSVAPRLRTVPCRA